MFGKFILDNSVFFCFYLLIYFSCREYIAHWIYFQILRRKKKPKRDRRSLLKSPFTQNRKSLIKETST